jgi:beta-glucosidase
MAADLNVDELLKKLTVSQKVELLSGIDFWHTRGIPEHGIPSVRLSDGPNGTRGTKFFNGVPAACFPCGTAMGATFNRDLLEEAGKTMGEEAKAKSAHAILGPTINIQRSPLGGRGFESISEDPFVAGLGAAALVRGIQSTGVQATIKHFLCNDQEDKRMSVQAIITERALREIYALPFQLTVRDAHPSAFMTAYNGINGTMVSENAKYLDEMLRKEWGWKGLIMSDWFGVYSTMGGVEAGLDLEMPGPSKFRGDALKFIAATGKPIMHKIDERVREVLEFVKRCAAAGVQENGPETTRDTPETAALLRKIGNESLVLLKNDRQVLPLSKERKTLVLGPNAKTATYHGGGSAALAGYYAVTPFDGITAKLAEKPAYTVGAYTHKFLPLLGPQVVAADGKQGMSWTVYREGPETPNREPYEKMHFTKTDMHLIDYYPEDLPALWYGELEGSFVAEEDCTYELSLVVSGTANAYVNDQLIVDNTTKQTLGEAFFGTGTIEERGTLQLTKGETYNFKIQFVSAPSSKLAGDSAFLLGQGALRVGGAKVINDQDEIAKSVALAKEHDQVIICAGLNAEWEGEGSDRQSMKLPGVLDQLISDVSRANPNTVVVMQTGTPEEMPWLEVTPAVVQAWYGGNETGNCIADVLFGDANPSGKLPLSFPRRLQDNPAFLNFKSEGGRTLYGEDVYVGYRYYDFANLAVNFAFGHGLSYTTFALSDLQLATSGEQGVGRKVSASLTVTNTGSVEGAEVAQLYVQPMFKSTKVNRPVRELKGFAKVELGPGESKSVTIGEMEKYMAAYWDEERDQWCVEAGRYDVLVDNSSAVTEKTLRASFEVAETYWWSGI